MLDGNSNFGRLIPHSGWVYRFLDGFNLRRVKDTDEIIVDVKLLCFALSTPLRLMDNDFFYKLI